MQKLKELDEFKNARSIMFYVSKGKEVYTKEIIKEFQGDRILLAPKTTGDIILPFVIDSFQNLVPNKYGILEPDTMKFKGRIDLVIVPGLVFDEKMNRIGYGQGYYDKFLKTLDCCKIALAFDFQIIDEFKVKDYDVPMNKIVTEERIIE